GEVDATGGAACARPAVQVAIVVNADHIGVGGGQAGIGRLPQVGVPSGGAQQCVFAAHKVVDGPPAPGRGRFVDGADAPAADYVVGCGEPGPVSGGLGCLGELEFGGVDFFVLGGHVTPRWWGGGVRAVV